MASSLNLRRNQARKGTGEARARVTRFINNVRSSWRDRVGRPGVAYSGQWHHEIEIVPILNVNRGQAPACRIKPEARRSVAFFMWYALARRVFCRGCIARAQPSPCVA